MKKSEAEVGQDVVMQLAKWGIKAMRNNRGMLYNQHGVPVHYGLGNTGKKNEEDFLSSDYVMCVPVVITPEMVGQTIGVFCTIETKASDWKWTGTKRELGQNNFIEFHKSKGGLGGFVKSVDDLPAILRR